MISQWIIVVVNRKVVRITKSGSAKATTEAHYLRKGVKCKTYMVWADCSTHAAIKFEEDHPNIKVPAGYKTEDLRYREVA